MIEQGITFFTAGGTKVDINVSKQFGLKSAALVVTCNAPRELTINALGSLVMRWDFRQKIGYCLTSCRISYLEPDLQTATLAKCLLALKARFSHFLSTVMRPCLVRTEEFSFFVNLALSKAFEQQKPNAMAESVMNVNLATCGAHGMVLPNELVITDGEIESELGK